MRLLSDVAASIEDPFMRRAYELSMRGLGRTSPNPSVGCVIVSSEGSVVGEGFHEQAGGPHAEIIALRQAGEQAADSTAYITLEPCTHHGRTPPCTEALIEAGVAHVVVGMRDPDPVAAGGTEVLRSFGIKVSSAPDSRPFEQLNEAWLKHLRTGLPWVTVKLAVSLDGKVSRAEGVRTSMSTPGSRPLTMMLRSRADAVVVGARTVVIDDPALTVRDERGIDATHQPLRVVLCRNVIPSKASMLTDGRAPVLVLVPTGGGDRSEVPSEVELVDYDGDEGPGSALEVLARRGIRRVLVEPGPHLLTALVQDGLIDELVLIHAGGFAGSAAPGMYTGPGEGTLLDLYRTFAAVEAGVREADAITVWRPAG